VNAEYHMTNRQLSALVEFCRNLPRPEQRIPSDSELRKAVEDGEEKFATVGCAECHQPNSGGIDGIYSDFLLYAVDSAEMSPAYRRFETLEVPMPVPRNRLRTPTGTCRKSTGKASLHSCRHYAHQRLRSHSMHRSTLPTGRFDGVC